jgi:hypothetical protein
MNIKEEVEKLNKIHVGYDIVLGEQKASQIMVLIDYIERNLHLIGKSITKEDVILVLQISYGVIYAIGVTKQYPKYPIDVEIAKRILPLARIIYGKRKELLSYLYLNLDCRDETKNKLLRNEIAEIEKNEK